MHSGGFERHTLRLFFGEEGGRLQGFLGTVAGILLILLITAFFVVRTPFFRTIVQDRIEKRTGLKVKVTRAYLGFPADLVVEGEEPDKLGGAAGPGLTFDRIRVALVPLGLFSRKEGLVRRCRVDSPRLVLARRHDGGWEPRAFEAFGDLADVNGLLALADGLRKNLRLEIRNGAVAWRDSDGVEVGYAATVNCTVTPVAVPGHQAAHFRVWVNRAELQQAGAGAADGRGTGSLSCLSVEWLAIDEAVHCMLNVSDEAGVVGARPAAPETEEPAGP